jgi:chemotaxis protein methyltransferase CheR
MPLDTILSLELTEQQFNEISTLVKSLCGINLHDGKKELVKARLTKRLRKLSLCSFQDYMSLVKSDAGGNELTNMLDALSTNLTSFFRENEHFEYLANNILPMIVNRSSQTGRRLRIWSAGCSSGEEPYTIGMVANDKLPNPASWDAKILATDLSTRVLARAAKGVYGAERVKTVPAQARSRYFDCIETRPDRIFRISESVRSMVHFARLNLMNRWPMQGPFDVIFCRNVMIYFDKVTQGRLINRFYELLAPGGTLFIGHSESLAGVEHKFNYTQPTIYQRP